MNDFATIIETQITHPLIDICRMLGEEQANDELFYFSGVLSFFGDPEDEAMVIAGCIELSRCAFLGFQYTPQVQEKINTLLDTAIDISHTMTAGDVN